MNINELLTVPSDKRDHDWEEKFFVAFTDSNIQVLSSEAQQGPDGWPYLLAETATETAEPEKSEPVQKILQWLASRGIGLAVNPTKSYPDFVFNYGMIWHFRETGLFYRRQDEIKGGAVTLTEGQKILAGPPTEAYLPNYVRKILREFFRDQGLLGVKILMISSDGQHYDLAFSLESIKNPPVHEHEGIAEAISWFLPPHYSILLTSEKGLPEFVAL
jgi:hypothetical protein